MWRVCRSHVQCYYFYLLVKGNAGRSSGALLYFEKLEDMKK